MYKSKQLYAAAAAAAVTAAAFAPVTQVSAATPVKKLPALIVEGGKVSLPKTYAGETIRWKSINSKIVGKYQTINGHYGKKNSPIQIKILIKNYPVGPFSKLQPLSVSLNGKLELPAQLKLRYADGKPYMRTITWGETRTDAVGEFTVTGTYKQDGRTITVTLPYSVKEDFNVSIMHTNDTHAALDNAPKRATAVKEFRASHKDALLIDAGDVFSGSLYFNQYKGQADLALMNLMGYDMMTFGNHEFDLGDKDGNLALSNFVRLAKFPFVASNVDFSKNSYFNGLQSSAYTKSPTDGRIYNGVVKEVNGQKIGFFGLTTEETKDISSPGSVTFKNYIDSAKSAVAAFKKQGISRIVAVTHIGFDDSADVDNDQLLAQYVDGIDIIIGGHSHTTLPAPVVIEKKEPTLIVQTGEYGKNLGTLSVKFDSKGRINGHLGKLIAIGAQEADPAAAALLQPYKDTVTAMLSKEIGVDVKTALTSDRNVVRVAEAPLGNLIADGMLAKAKQSRPETTIAVQNGGGIRADINAGPLTAGEVLTTLPFGNTLAVARLTGTEVKAMMEESIGLVPTTFGGFLQISGMKVKYDSTKAQGSRVVSIEVKEGDAYVALDSAKTYTVATNAFTAKGDENKAFKPAYLSGRVTDLGLSDWEVFTEYAKSLGTLDPKVEGRIVDVSK